ncbi:MAG: CUB domain-containing protein, partial [Bacteroidota bacterium]
MNKIKLFIAALLIGGFGLNLNAQTYLISDGGTENTCSGTLYDSGGASADYGNDESITYTICSDNSAQIELDFSVFNLATDGDELIVYDGPNTAAPLLASGDGNDLQGELLTSGGNCLTLVFTSNSSGTDSGFAADISCGSTCQNFYVEWESTDPAITNTDSMFIDICNGETIDFSVEGDYPFNNNGYTQSDATTHFEWEVFDGENNEIYEGTDLTDLTYTFDEEGGYFVTVTATDANGCT